jgi:hypothetical protein
MAFDYHLMLPNDLAVVRLTVLSILELSLHPLHAVEFLLPIDFAFDV